MHQAILDKIAAVPGVTSVALASTVTMAGQGWHDPIYAQDRPTSEAQLPPIRLFKLVSPGFLKTMGNRSWPAATSPGPTRYELRPVAMVSENLARELWGEPSAALGKRVRPNATGVWREVVGVVGDVRDDGLDKKAPTIVFWPMLMSNFIAAKGDDPRSRAIARPT